MSSIRTNNDLGHPLCHNLREGNWLMEYTAQRLMRFEGTKKVSFMSKCELNHYKLKKGNINDFIAKNNEKFVDSSGF